EVYAYGLEIFLSSALQLLAFIALGLIFGQLLTTIAFLASFIPLRTVAGGFHARTHFRCFLGFCAIYAVFLGLLHLIPAGLSGVMAMVFVGVAAIPVLVFAPLPDANKPVGSKKLKTYRRKSLVRFFVIAAIIAALGIASVFFDFVPVGIVLAFSIGQLAAAGSLVAAKMKNFIQLRRHET
ncbi:MAG: accessory gene regulator B family protein, partial [Defluviitaleaceae bacterium]|nr:accessory gene regulator B family protein [Defluviitaleaceae bacterium]